MNRIIKNIALITVLFAILPLTVAHSTDLTLGWLPNSEVNLQGYKVYYGTESHYYSTDIDVGNPPPVKGLITVKIIGLIPYTTYYFSVTSYNDQGVSSELSPELTWTCQFRYDRDIFIDPANYNPAIYCFSTITDGYNAVDEKGELYISAEEFFENLNFNQPKQVYLSAGWENEFHLNSTCTTIVHGTLTITAGTIIVDSLTIEP